LSDAKHTDRSGVNLRPSILKPSIDVTKTSILRTGGMTMQMKQDGALQPTIDIMFQLLILHAIRISYGKIHGMVTTM